MAANYWVSTQRNYWQFTRESLAEARDLNEEEDRSLVQQYALPDWRLLSVFFNQRMTNHSLGIGCDLTEYT
jgi:cyclin C